MGSKDHCRTIHCTTGRIKTKNPAERLSFSHFSKNAIRHSSSVWESRWPSLAGLSVLTSLLASVDVKIYWTMLQHWSQRVPNILADIWGHEWPKLKKIVENKVQFCRFFNVFFLIFFSLLFLVSFLLLHLIQVYRLCTQLLQYITLLLERENVCAWGRRGE